MLILVVFWVQNRKLRSPHIWNYSPESKCQGVIVSEVWSNIPFWKVKAAHSIMIIVLHITNHPLNLELEYKNSSLSKMSYNDIWACQMKSSKYFSPSAVSHERRTNSSEWLGYLSGTLSERTEESKSAQWQSGLQQSSSSQIFVASKLYKDTEGSTTGLHRFVRQHWHLRWQI